MGSLLWGAAVTTFGVGDVLTTYYGLQQEGVHESHPLSEFVLGSGGAAGMVAMKLVVFAVALYAARNVAPEEWAVGIPIGLTLLGTVVVANNLSVMEAAQ